MDKLTLLKGVREYLTDPAKWRKDDYGDYYGNGPCCILGAARAVAYKAGADELEQDKAMHEYLAPYMPPTFIFKENFGDFSGKAKVAAFNDADTTTHEDVLKVLDCAIARAEGPIS